MSKLNGRGVKVHNAGAVTNVANGDTGVIVSVNKKCVGPVCVAFGEGYTECFHYTQLRYLNNKKVVI